MKRASAAPNPTTSPKINVPIGCLAPPRPVYVIRGHDRIESVNAGDGRIGRKIEPELDPASSTAAPDRHDLGGGGLEPDFRALKPGPGVRLRPHRTVTRISTHHRPAFPHAPC